MCTTPWPEVVGTATNSEASLTLAVRLRSMALEDGDKVLVDDGGDVLRLTR